MPSSMVDIDLIHPHPANIREDTTSPAYRAEIAELADSIRSHGILERIVVQPHPNRRGHLQLIAGERRLEAARLAGRTGVEIDIRYGLSDTDVLVLMLIENCQRRQLTPMEKAEALEALVHRGMTASEIAKQTGFPLGSVSYHLTLLQLDQTSREKVHAGELTASEAVDAVRRTRRTERRKRGSTATWKWEPDHLASEHPLAGKAKTLCESRKHNTRRRVGKTACGACWEDTIRADERAKILAELATDEQGKTGAEVAA
ncbi:ParB/RepB/Spo0J family partition protein [Actinomadura sp. 3N407]|uniref:ParB/RepB/Spo0J family partition protein n=1 Tax=Actinomadura sp. 3N407 TaxID=3457423 RepID=UPI003FCE5BC0